MQIMYNDKTVRSNIIQNMKEVKSQHLATRDKNAKIFDLKVDGILDKSTENELLKNRISSYVEWEVVRRI